MSSTREIIDSINNLLRKNDTLNHPDTMLMAPEWFFAYKRELFRMRHPNLRVEPITLRNPFTGEIFWMQS